MKIKPVLRANKITKLGQIPIFFRFTLNRKTNYISSGITCRAVEWNEFEGRLWERKPTPKDLERMGIFNVDEKGLEGLKEYCKNVSVNRLAKKYNEEIDMRLNTYEIEKTRASFSTNQLTSKSFKLLLKKEDGNAEGVNFIEYWKKRISQFRKAEAVSSADTYQDVLDFFEAYTKKKTIYFHDITHDFIDDFTSYIKRQRKKNGDPFSQNYIYKLFKTVRALYNHGVEAKVYDSKDNPFTLQNVQAQTSTHKERLSESELNRLISISLQKGSQVFNARNAFVFAVLNGGTRISDVLLIRWKNITKDNRITYSMRKTKDQSSLPMHPLAIQIIKNYRTNIPDDNSFIFPFLKGFEKEINVEILQKKIESKTTMINSSLKLLAELAGIDKSITTHMARHSYAALTILHNANPMVTKKVLRHKKFETTQGYIGELNNELVDSVHLASLINLKIGTIEEASPSK